MNDMLGQVREKLDAMTTRERVIIAITLVVATVFLWSELILSGQLAQKNSAARQISGLEGQIATLQIEQAKYQKQLAQDPDRELQVRLERYEDEIARVDQLLEEQTLEFISPRQMVTVLRNMIRKESGLKLVRMESLDPVDPVVALGSDNTEADTERDGKSKQPSSGAYLHALEMEFEGDYLAVLKYIRHLESLEWKFVWRSLSVELVDYPTTTARLRLETLSQSDRWIGV